MALIQYQKGDIFDSKGHVIVNTVNCKGVMGKGLALAFKQRYSAMFAIYQQECKKGKLRIGKPTLYRASIPWILNFPTKDDWRLPSKLEYLEKGLEYVVANYKEEGIKSIAFPKLGAQNGKLSWDDVGPLMAKYLSQLDIDVYIYIAAGDREYQCDQSDIKKRIWKQFSELACFEDRLHQEVQLSAREAKKVAKQAAIGPFGSLADVENIGLAKVSIERVKKYITQQQYTKVELSNLQCPSYHHPQDTKKPNKTPKRGRKKGAAGIEAIPEALFSLHELASQPTI